MKKLSQFLIENEKFFNHIKHRYPEEVAYISMDSDDIFDPYFQFIDSIDDQSASAFKTFFKIYLKKSELDHNGGVETDTVFDDIEVLRRDIALSLSLVYAVQYYFL